MRRAAASFFCLCLFAGDASACFMEADHSSIFLREPFDGLDAPVIAQISIRKIVSEFVPYKIGAVGSPIWIGWYVADARVDKLLRGHLEFSLPAPIAMTSCGLAFPVRSPGDSI
jgi:hypothetical protein